MLSDSPYTLQDCQRDAGREKAFHIIPSHPVSDFSDFALLAHVPIAAFWKPGLRARIVDWVRSTHSQSKEKRSSGFFVLMHRLSSCVL